MSIEEKAMEEWLGFLSPMGHLIPEMVIRIQGDEPLVMAVDPASGLIWLGRIDGERVTTLAKWSGVQAERLRTIHERAINVLESGLGSLR